MKHFVVALGLWCTIVTGIAWASANVAVRRAGRIVLSLTPQAIGDNVGREELKISVDSDSASPVFCGYTAALSMTPGPDSGERWDARDKDVTCKYPQLPYICISDGATLSYNEAYVRTATATATPTITPTPA